MRTCLIFAAGIVSGGAATYFAAVIYFARHNPF